MPLETRVSDAVIKMGVSIKTVALVDSFSESLTEKTKAFLFHRTFKSSELSRYLGKSTKTNHLNFFYQFKQ